MNKEVKPIDELAFDLSHEWRAEIEKRCAEVDLGLTELTPADEVVEKLRERHK
jgi:hypothetical protein